jgi:hypothetical protein
MKKEKGPDSIIGEPSEKMNPVSLYFHIVCTYKSNVEFYGSKLDEDMDRLAINWCLG